MRGAGQAPGRRECYLVYRAGADAMSATTWEQTLPAPMTDSEIMGDHPVEKDIEARSAQAVFEYPLVRRKLAGTGRVSPPPMLCSAIGQSCAAGRRAIEGGKIWWTGIPDLPARYFRGRRLHPVRRD